MEDSVKSMKSSIWLVFFLSVGYSLQGQFDDLMVKVVLNTFAFSGSIGKLPLGVERDEISTLAAVP